MVMVEYGDTNHQKTVLKDGIGALDVFDQEQLHFNVALGIIIPFAPEMLKTDAFLELSAEI